VAFYSFKGGVGRSTALASFALQRAQAGDRVAVIDLDLDAPGIGTLLACDENGGTALWGVADYLLEKQFKDFIFQDYYHLAALPNLDPRPKGEVIVFPAGKINDDYIGKLVRLDLEPTANNVSNTIRTLLMDVKKELKPNWILLDVRAGLSEISGLIADGLSHLYVVFGTGSRQSLQGIGIFFDTIGRRRIIAGASQLDCLVVHAMVPRPSATAEPMKTRFEAELNELLGEVYYAASDTEVEGNPWTISDAGQSNAPDVPIVIQYDEALAGLDSITREVEKVTTGGYRELTRRIMERFGKKI
jgi:cellulose biosynthesis protein BcsQ